MTGTQKNQGQPSRPPATSRMGGWVGWGEGDYWGMTTACLFLWGPPVGHPPRKHADWAPDRPHVAGLPLPCGSVPGCRPKFK